VYSRRSSKIFTNKVQDKNEGIEYTQHYGKGIRPIKELVKKWLARFMDKEPIKEKLPVE
jgi:hypothetical protein